MRISLVGKVAKISKNTTQIQKSKKALKNKGKYPILKHP